MKTLYKKVMYSTNTSLPFLFARPCQMQIGDISVVNVVPVSLIEPFDSLQTSSINPYECNKAFSYLILLQPLSEMRPSENRGLYSETDI